MLDAEEARRSLSEFIRQGWHVLEPGTPLEWNWHINAVADHLQAAFEDWMVVQRWRLELSTWAEIEGVEVPEHIVPPAQRIQNLIINIPPGTAKSRIVMVYFVAWAWLHWPSWSAICVSSNPRNSDRDSDYCRTLIKSEWYQDTFQPAWRLDKDGTRKFTNTAHGWRQALGFNARITGGRADAILVDDPHDAGEVHSEKLRKNVLNKYDDAIGNRVNDLRSSLRIGIMQRLHEMDWTGHNLAKGGWEHLCLPMEYVPVGKRLCPCASCKKGETSIGWRDPRSKPGEILHPIRFTPVVLAAEKTRLGSSGYAGQMQQWPVPADGALFKEIWFVNRYKRLPELVEVWTTWDTAMKDGEENDETACVVAGKSKEGRCVILRVLHGRWETPQVAEFLVAQAEWLRSVYGDRYQGDYVEDKVSGTTLMQYLRRTHSHIVIVPITVEGDKVQRAHGVAPLCEAGSVLLPDGYIYPDTAENIGDLLKQLKTFPLSDLKDIVDAFVYTLKKFLGTLGKKKARRGKRGGTV